MTDIHSPLRDLLLLDTMTTTMLHCRNCHRCCPRVPVVFLIDDDRQKFTGGQPIPVNRQLDDTIRNYDDEREVAATGNSSDDCLLHPVDGLVRRQQRDDRGCLLQKAAASNSLQQFCTQPGLL